MPGPVDYLAIGHVAKDLLPGSPNLGRLGGSVAYASLTAQALGHQPGIITAYGDDLDISPLEQFPLLRVPSMESTTFENIYGPQGRMQFLRARAAPLTYAAIPPDWRDARIIHLAPLARELEPEIAVQFPERFVGLTPQGWLRRWDAQGRVSYEDWPEVAEIRPRVVATVLSIEDIQGDWARAERWAKAAQVLVVTEGALGCTVFVRGEQPQRFSALPQPESDPTGAGDIFAAAFFIHLYESRDPWASAQFANRVAAPSVTRPGLKGVPSPEEIESLRAEPMA